MKRSRKAGLTVEYVDGLLVNNDVLSTRFACDLCHCRGACCTMPGGTGAPLTDAEVPEVIAAVEAARPYLSTRKRALIDAKGAVEGSPGNYTTRCVDDADCVFVTYDGDIAFCAIERAWREGKTSFRKPLSCHLFPIRVDDLFGSDRLRYEMIEECAGGVARGRTEGIPLIVFLEEPLTRAFGPEVYEELRRRVAIDTDNPESV